MDVNNNFFLNVRVFLRSISKNKKSMRKKEVIDGETNIHLQALIDSRKKRKANHHHHQQQQQLDQK